MLSMEKNVFLEFYANTVEEYCAQMKKQVSGILEKEHLITFSEQKSIDDASICKYFPKKDYTNILKTTASDEEFLEFYNRFDFIKMYKYSIPFFYEGNAIDICTEMVQKGEFLISYQKECRNNFVIASNYKEVIAEYYKIANDKCAIKFVFQKSYIKDFGETVDYRYVVVVFFDEKNHLLEIRYDSLKHSPTIDSRTAYMSNVENTIKWLKTKMELKLFRCNSDHFLDIVKQNTNDIKIFKQMMDMGSSGAAELTASQDEDFILPFIDELKELINENEELFNQNSDIKELLLEYLKEKEVTASYPYVYLLWRRAVVSNSFIVKVTFSYFDNQYIQLQHLTGTCTDFRMERMNDAIEYFGSSGAFTKGEEI